MNFNKIRWLTAGVNPTVKNPKLWRRRWNWEPWTECMISISRFRKPVAAFQSGPISDFSVCMIRIFNPGFVLFNVNGWAQKSEGFVLFSSRCRQGWYTKTKLGFSCVDSNATDIDRKRFLRKQRKLHEKTLYAEDAFNRIFAPVIYGSVSLWSLTLSHGYGDATVNNSIN